MPYIPNEHKEYKLLPHCCTSGGEVFEYPSEMLDKVDKLLPEGETLRPYGYKSYDEYYSKLDGYIESLDDENAKRIINSFGNRMVAINIKNTWAVLKYTGKTSEDEGVGLTHGRFYYCPAPTPDHGMIGIIDNEEFTSYMYPCDLSDWIVYEDPTGEAGKALGQKPKVDRMCPCCRKHYFFPDDVNNLCPVCQWERDIMQENNPDEEGGANSRSLNEERKLFNPKGADITQLFRLAFKSLSTSQIDFICDEFNTDADTLLELSERQLDCVYNVLDLYAEAEYGNNKRRTKRYNMFLRIQTCLEESFKGMLGIPESNERILVQKREKI